MLLVPRGIEKRWQSCPLLFGPVLLAHRCCCRCCCADKDVLAVVGKLYPTLCFLRCHCCGCQLCICEYCCCPFCSGQQICVDVALHAHVGFELVLQLFSCCIVSIICWWLQLVLLQLLLLLLCLLPLAFLCCGLLSSLLVEGSPHS